MSYKINWIEIPATQHQRAVDFYSALLDAPLQAGEMFGNPYTMLPDNLGAITHAEHTEPSAHGVTIYIHVGDELDPVLERVQQVGGTIIVPKSPLGNANHFAIIHDSEGNRIGLFAIN